MFVPQKKNDRFWSGYSAAKWDLRHKGEQFVVEHSSKINGCSKDFVNGYNFFAKRYK